MSNDSSNIVAKNTMHALLLVLALVALAVARPVHLIVDTDIGGGGCQDVDDIAAVCIANALADNGEAELLAIVQNTAPPPCAGVISVLNHWYGRDDVPLGAYKGTGLTHSNPPLSFVDDLVANYPSPVKNSSQVPDAVSIYRQALAAAPDASVAISSIGLLTNLENLLRSGPDQYSALSGVDLVAQKVFLLVAMAGKYPTSNGGANGAECNMCGCYNGADATSAQTAASSSIYVFSHMAPTVKVLFSGGEVGVEIRTGAVLETCAEANNPCRRAFMDFKRDNPGGWAKGGRSSWDPLTILVAVRGASAAGNGVTECDDCDGTNSVTEGGNNHWVAGPPSNQTYLILHDANVAAKAIDTLLCQRPRQQAAAVLS